MQSAQSIALRQSPQSMPLTQSAQSNAAQVEHPLDGCGGGG
jgi:hypothetical protein